MMHPLLALPISIVFLLVIVGFGRKFLSLMRLNTSSRAEISVFGLAIGLGLTAYAVLAIGLLRELHSYVLLGLIAVMGVVSFGEIRTMLRECVSGLRENSGSTLNWADGLIALSCAALGGLALINVLSPPTSMDWDGLSYHLAVPKLYLSHHAVYYIPFTSHSNFPFLTEMLYTIGLSIGSTGVAKFFHFSMYIGTALALYALCRRHVNPSVGKIAALLYMSTPVVFYEAGIAYADITMGFYILLAFYAMLNWQETKAKSWMVLCSVMCGFALGTKVFTAVPIVVICSIILASSGREGRWGKGLAMSLAVGLGAVAVGCVWYVKSLIYTGNPVYPFLYNVFGGKNWSAEAASIYQAEQSSFGMGKGIGQLILLPWNLLTNGVLFTNKSNANYFALIGPAFLGLIPLYALKGKPNRAVLNAAAIAAVFLLSWFFLMQHSRYLIAAVPLLCIVAAAGAYAAFKGSWATRSAIVGILAVSVIPVVWSGADLTSMNYRAAIGLESSDEFLTKYVDVYEAESWANKNLPSTARVVLFDETRGFYLDRDYIWGNPGHHEMIPWKQFRKGNDMVRWFVDHGYTHLLINQSIARGASDDIHGKLFPEAIEDGSMRELYSTKTCTIYEFHK